MSEKESPPPAAQNEFSNQISHIEKTDNTSPTGLDETEDPDFKFGVTRAIAFVGIVLGFFSDTFVAACVSAVLSTINQDLGPSTSYVWILSAIYTTVSITAPFIGRLGDIFGRKYLLIIGNILGGVGTLVSALATNLTALIAGSVVIGLGSSMHQLGWAAVGEIVPKKHRPLAMGVYEGAISPASFLGALIGYSLLDHTSLGWRNIYWIAFSLHGLAFFILIFFYHPVNQYIKEEGKSTLDQIKSLDYIGSGLFTIGLCLFLCGLSFGGTKYPWKSAGTLAPLLIGVLFLIFTGLYENYTYNPYNIFPHSVMKDFRGFSIVTGVVFLVGILYYSSLILWPLQIVTFYTTDSTTIGLYSLAFSLGGCIGALLFALVLEKVNQARWILTAVCVLTTLFIGCQAIVGIHTNVASTVLVILTGAMVAAATVTSNTMIQLAVPHQYLGVAMGLVTTSRNVGGSVGSTVYTVILNNQLTSNLGKNVATALATAGVPLAKIPAIAEALATGDQSSPALASVTPEELGAGVLALELTYVHAFKIIFLVSIAFGILGTVCAVFSKNVGEFMTNKVDVELDEAVHVGFHEVHKGGHVLAKDGTDIGHSPAGAV